MVTMSTYEEIPEYDYDEYWPTTTWLEKYEEDLTDSDELSRVMGGWGQGFNGDFVFEIRNLPIEENEVKDLPEEVWKALDKGIRQLPEAVLETVLEDAPEAVQDGIEEREGPLPERAANELLETKIINAPDKTWDGLRRVMPDVLEFLLDQLEENVTDDGHVYAWIGLEDGDCTGVDTLMNLDDRDKGFVLTGEYDQWVRLVTSELDVVEGIMSGDLELDGDMQKILQYADAALMMTDIASATDKRFLF